MKRMNRQPRATLQRRKFLQQMFGGVGIAAVGATSARVFGADAPKAAVEDPYATTNTVPRVQGKPPQFKEKLKITKLETFLVKPR